MRTRRPNDSWQSQTHGIRLDWTSGRDAVMAEGGATLGKLRALFRAPSGPVPGVKAAFNDFSYTHEYDVLGRWTHRRDSGASLQLQSSIDYHHNDDVVTPTQVQADVDAQYHTAIGSRHDLVVGAGYRFIDEKLEGAFSFSITPSTVEESVVNFFAQDEIALERRVRLTLGTKVERDSYVGWSAQPTAARDVTPVPQQHVWAAVSRALRTPALGDVSGRYNYTSFVGQGGLPVVVGALGNPALQSEEVVDTDVGYRREIGSVASVGRHGIRRTLHGLKNSEPLAPRMELTPAPAHLLIATQFANLLDATPPA